MALHEHQLGEPLFPRPGDLAASHLNEPGSAAGP